MNEFEYPKEYRENLVWRTKLLRRAQLDKGYRRVVRELFFRDPLFAFNGFFYTLDVRVRPRHQQPFCTYPFQDDLILDVKRTIDAGEDLVVEKSRDMGCSWIFILMFQWFWLDPAGGSDFLLGSRIEDYVDKKGDMRTLLEKARYNLYRLPGWLRPKGFRKNIHDNFMRLQNPETGASITGESNNANFSTGGRYLGVLFDEFAKWESTDKSAWTAAGDATPSRIALSTPFGAAGQYYDLVTDGKTRKITLHWSLHPKKAVGSYCNYPLKEDEKDEEAQRLIRSPWYDMQCVRRRPLEIAQELDIDYIGAGNPVFDGRSGKRVLSLLKGVKRAIKWYEPMFAEKTLKEVEAPRDSEGYLQIYDILANDDLAVLGVDVVEGVEHGDFAVIKVLSRKRKSIIASYYSKIDEVQLAAIISFCSKFFTTYETPWIAIETIGPGLSTFDLCVEVWEVPNLFMMPKFDQTKETVSWKKGWRTDSVSRNRLISTIREWLLAGEGWCDQRLAREFTTFIKNKTGRGEAKEGAHDDEVIAFGIALEVDILAPSGEVPEVVAKRSDGLPERMFILEELRQEGEPVTIEERCMATVVAKMAEKAATQREFYENTLDLIYG